jgi:cytochrome c oxidase subunit 4
MSTHDSPEAIQAETRRYLMVFAALATLTIVTVGVSYIDLNIGLTVTLAMIVATVKGTLVAAYFMHLLDERKMIYAILGLTMIFFVFLMTVPAGTFADHTGESTEVARDVDGEHH